MQECSGLSNTSPAVEQIPGMPETDSPFRRKCRITWVALIKAVYEALHSSVEVSLKCPITQDTQ